MGGCHLGQGVVLISPFLQKLLAERSIKSMQLSSQGTTGIVQSILPFPYHHLQAVLRLHCHCDFRLDCLIWS